MDKNSFAALRKQIRRFIETNPLVKIPIGKKLRIDVSIYYEDLPGELEFHLNDEKCVRLVASKQVFTDEHFEEILELPLSVKEGFRRVLSKQ